MGRRRGPSVAPYESTVAAGGTVAAAEAAAGWARGRLGRGDAARRGDFFAGVWRGRPCASGDAGRLD